MEEDSEIDVPLDGRVTDGRYVFRVQDGWESNVLLDALAFSRKVEMGSDGGPINRQ